VTNVSPEEFGAAALAYKLDQMPVDSRISYPCYKSFDEFIDIEKLRSLDEYLSKKIEHYMRSRQQDYFLNAFRLDSSSPYQPGAREIWLSKPKAAKNGAYNDLDNTELWERTKESEDFPLLMEFIETLPFKAFGRMLIIYDDAPHAVPAHRDHLNTDICHDFIWFRTNLRKPFYMLNHKTGEKLYVKSYSAWFDSVNQFHGVDPQEGLSFSFRIDGIFTDEFKAKIPKPEFNLASTPALWACLSETKAA
jgi:hypothetical protein